MRRASIGLGTGASMSCMVGRYISGIVRRCECNIMSRRITIVWTSDTPCPTRPISCCVASMQNLVDIKLVSTFGMWIVIGHAVTVMLGRVIL